MYLAVDSLRVRYVLTYKTQSQGRMRIMGCCAIGRPGFTPLITNLFCGSLLTLYFCGWSVEGPNKLLLTVFIQVRLKNKKIGEIKGQKYLVRDMIV